MNSSFFSRKDRKESSVHNSVERHKSCGEGRNISNDRIIRDRVGSSTPSYYVQRAKHSRTHLLALTWGQRWEDVLQRIRTHPEEARHINESLRSPLHLCMFGFDSLPASVVVSVLGANQFAVIHKDSIGWTPIHYACQFGVSADIITLLLCAAVSVKSSAQDPSSSSSSSVTTSPLFLSCNRNADTQVLSVLLDYSISYPNEIGWWIAPCTGAERYDDDGYTRKPALVASLHQLSIDDTIASANCVAPCRNTLDSIITETEDNINANSNLTPLQVLWSHFPSDRSWRREKDHSITASAINPSIVKQDFIPFWEKVIQLLSFHDCRVQKGDVGSPKYNIDTVSLHKSDRKDLLHHACALRRPIPELVNFILKLYPHQTLKYDSRGNLPLHYAIGNLSYPELDKCKRIQIFSDVLLANTAAASLPDKNSRLCLFLAIRTISWEDGLDTLVSAAPHVLQIVDKGTRMCPFMLAATVNSTSVNTVFALLKSCPEAISYALAEA